MTIGVMTMTKKKIRCPECNSPHITYSHETNHQTGKHRDFLQCDTCNHRWIPTQKESQ
jgi:DNA-directed RNA polymerase subunit M/transcription elongation factor TFIIS